MTSLENKNTRYRNSKAYHQLLDTLSHDMIEEEKLHAEKRHEQAAEIGIKIWQTIKAYIDLSGVNNVYEIGRETGYDLLYWAAEFSDTLFLASRCDKRYYDIHLQFCQEYTDMHADLKCDDVNNLGNIHRALAECYARKNDYKTCDKLFRQWLEKEPNWGWGWIGWSDCYWFKFITKEPEYARAEAILKEALTQYKGPELVHIKERLDGIQREKVKDNLQVIK